MNIEQIVGLVTSANIIPFVLGILTSEATRRLFALALRSWGKGQVAAAAKTPELEDDASAKTKAEIAEVIAEAVEPPKKVQ